MYLIWFILGFWKFSSYNLVWNSLFQTLAFSTVPNPMTFVYAFVVENFYENALDDTYYYGKIFDP